MSITFEVHVPDQRPSTETLRGMVGQRVRYTWPGTGSTDAIVLAAKPTRSGYSLTVEPAPRG